MDSAARNPADSCSMDKFLDIVIERINKPKTGANIAKTVAATALINLLTLPFGFMGARVYRSKRPSEIKKEFDTALYGRFKAGWFEDFAQTERKDAEKAALVSFFDGLSINEKTQILTTALTKPSEYQNFLNEFTRRLVVEEENR